MTGLIKEIALFSIISGIIINILPDSKTRKYINLFISIVYILMIIGSVSNYRIDALLKDDVNTIYVRDKSVDVVSETVKEIVKSEVNKYSSQRQLKIYDVDVEVDESLEGVRIKSVRLKADEAGVNSDIRGYICEKYMLDEGSVVIEKY